MNQKIVASIRELFIGKFGSEPLLARAPGRINLIGEHTDYNEGFVLPAAIDKAIYVAAGKRNDDKICLYSVEYLEEFETTVRDVQPVTSHWPNYILGVVDQLTKRNFTIKGFNLVIDGDVPLGAGLSSSAAVECATAVMLNKLFELGISHAELVAIAQKAEHEFAGVMCGIMDQFASTFGKKHHVIRLDCRSLDYQYEPLDLKDYGLVLLNTNVKHSLASTEYNVRRQECARGVEVLNNAGISVNSLRDVTIDMLEKYVKPIDEIVFSRCKYVVDENERLLKACEALEQGNLELVGALMFATHHGLSKEYAVSCNELDFLVDEVKNHTSVAGARMMGGGFGGCTINLVRKDAFDALFQSLAEAYKKTFDKDLSIIIVETADGASVLE